LQIQYPAGKQAVRQQLVILLPFGLIQNNKMRFDKTKAMRNAERYLSQGDITSAIGEFKQVVSHDPHDFSTMNILGDLHVKNADINAAVGCYRSVAEHYSDEGFAHKAIAIYNKISKLTPGSIEISARLAELYKEKGSLKEARSHYETLATYLQKTGMKVEALEIWKQVGILDPNNAEVFVKIAESYLEEDLLSEATEAFCEAARRFRKHGKIAESLAIIERSMELDTENVGCIREFAEIKLELRRGDEAVARLLELQEKFPFNIEIRSILVDCYVKLEDLGSAEEVLTKLVEQDPSNYPKLLELSRLYLDNGDLLSSVRLLLMSSEHLFISGKPGELIDVVESVLEDDPDQVDALRLLVQYRTWQKDEAGYIEALVKLAKAARNTNNFDDERSALSQLLMVAPHESEYRDRLSEINAEHGFADEAASESWFDKRFVEHEITSAAEITVIAADKVDVNLSEIAAVEAAEHSNGNGHSDLANGNGVIDEAFAGKVEAASALDTAFQGADAFAKEIETIKFYIDSGYKEIAEKAIDEFRAEHGSTPEVEQLAIRLNGGSSGRKNGYDIDPPLVVGEPVVDAVVELEDLRNELGLDDASQDPDEDFDTHYQTAVAYQEMHLLEDAINEFQTAISLVDPNDGTRRFYQCATLLGHCFMQIGKPNLAVKWHLRALEKANIGEEEKQGLWYELAAAYEADGDVVNAGRYYEQVYAENINFRDVSERVGNLAEVR
jgi:tetratricopeptide (TPR) repeat protein